MLQIFGSKHYALKTYRPMKKMLFLCVFPHCQEWFNDRILRLTPHWQTQPHLLSQLKVLLLLSRVRKPKRPAKQMQIGFPALLLSHPLPSTGADFMLLHLYLGCNMCPRSDGKGTASSSLQHECNTGPFDVRTPCGMHAGRARVAKHRSNLWPTDTWHTQLCNQPKRCRLTPSCPLQARGTEASPEEPAAISAGHLAASGYQLSACCFLCWGTQFKWDMRQTWRGTN